MVKFNKKKFDRRTIMIIIAFKVILISAYLFFFVI